MTTLVCRFRVVVVAVAVIAALLFHAAPAAAQLHWDASAQVGAMKRELGSRPSGGRDAGFGPVAELEAHVALIPLVRLGAYVGHDISPIYGDSSARDLTWGGLHAKIMSPWPRGKLRAWLFTGFGYAGVYARSTAAPRIYPGPAGVPAVSSDAVVQGSHGGFFDVPFGIGASYKLRKPFELCAELGMHAGFGFRGRVYREPGPLVTSPVQPESHALPAGNDGFGIGLTVGVLVDL